MALTLSTLIKKTEASLTKKHLYGQLTYDKEANEEKTVSSINDVGKTRQSHAKE